MKQQKDTLKNQDKYKDKYKINLKQTQDPQ